MSHCKLSIAGVCSKVWIVGSSIIKQAFTYARQSTEVGISLGLGPYGASVWWQGQSGMRCHHLLQKLQLLLSIEDPPQILILHVGGNDINQVPSVVLRHRIVKLMHDIRKLIPQVMIVWSQILPRLAWRGEVTHKAVNKIRVRINSKVATEVLKINGAYLRYPELVETKAGLFCCDGTHLSDKGNQLFLDTMTKGLQLFLTSNERIFPLPN